MGLIHLSCLLQKLLCDDVRLVEIVTSAMCEQGSNVATIEPQRQR